MVLHDQNFPWTGAELLTRTKTVGADGPLGVLRADVTLLALLLRKGGIRQRRSLVFWSERMEDQTWDAAAGAPFLW